MLKAKRLMADHLQFLDLLQCFRTFDTGNQSSVKSLGFGMWW